MRATVVFMPLFAAVAFSTWPQMDAELPPSPDRAEVSRIRAHFDSVLSELNQEDVQRLTASQRANRSNLIGTLAAYRDRGLFPNNYDFPGQAVPYFVDRGTGVLCAVAHLLESTGRRDIVDRVARTNNNVWVPDLEGDSELSAWLDDQGLTLAEAARIQVPYIMDDDVQLNQTSRDATYNIGSGLAFAAAGGLATWNFMGNRAGKSRLVTAAGLAVGLAATGYGGLALNDPTADKALGALASVAGLASTWLATQSFRQRRTDIARARTAHDARRVSVAPVAPVRGRNGAGLSLSIAF